MDSAPITIPEGETEEYYLKPNMATEIILDSKNYIIIKDGEYHNFSVMKGERSLFIITYKYELKMSLEDFQHQIKKFFDNLKDAYFFLCKVFEQKKVSIKSIDNEKMVLLIKIYDPFGEEKLFEFNLYFNDDIDKDTQIKNLYTQCSQMEKEIAQLKNELKTMSEKLNRESKSSQKFGGYSGEIHDISFIGELSKGTYNEWGIDYVFTVFMQNKINYLVYGRKDELVCYNLNEFKEVMSKKTGTKSISNINYIFDDINHRDIILTVSHKSNNIVLWDFTCIGGILPIVNIQNVNKKGYTLSAILIKYNEEIYTVTSNGDISTNSFNPIQLYNTQGGQFMSIKESKFNTNFITSYFNKEKYLYLIISGNDGFLNSYKLNDNNIYHKFIDNDNNKVSYRSAVILEGKKLIKLIASSDDGFLRIWNLLDFELLNKIFTGVNALRGICIWREDLIFVGCKDKTIKLIDVDRNKIIKCVPGHNGTVLTIKLINHPYFGSCILSQGIYDDQIKLWAINYN